VQMAQGGLEGALNSYQDGLDTIILLTKTGPDNAERQHERLAFIKKIDKVADARERLNTPKRSDGNALFVKLLAKSDPRGVHPPYKHGWYSPPQQQSFEDIY
jgi:hypothetical protein